MHSEVITPKNGSLPPDANADTSPSASVDFLDSGKPLGGERTGGVRADESAAEPRGSAPASDQATDAVASTLAAKLRESLRQSLALLSDPSHDLDRAVHAVRKSNKSVAATFWLLKPWVSAESFERARNLVKESSRLLQRQRRAVALLATLGRLDGEDAESRGALEEQLSADRKIDGDVIDQVRRHLADALDEVAAWPRDSVRDKELISRFQKTRRRTRRIARAARRKASAEKLHDLRKQVKRQTALGAALSPFLESQPDGERLDALADRLGNVNDLEDLRAEVRGVEKTTPTRELRRLHKRVRRRQRKEIEGSLALARKVLKKG